MSSIFTLEDFEDEFGSSDNKRFFVHTDNYHYKYYIINLDTWVCKYGRIWNNPVEVKYRTYELGWKISEKLRKGYREIFSKSDLDNFNLNNL